MEGYDQIGQAQPKTRTESFSLAHTNTLLLLDVPAFASWSVRVISKSKEMGARKHVEWNLQAATSRFSYRKKSVFIVYFWSITVWPDVFQ